MRITGIVWLDSVVEKIDAKHGISREEVCQVIRDSATMFRLVENGHRRGENEYAALGRSEQASI
jgi:hypothetical protein